MPRFYFHTHDGRDVVDPVGEDLADIDAARRRAMTIAAGFVTEPGMLRTDGGAVVVDVRDGADAPVLTARLVISIAMA